MTRRATRFVVHLLGTLIGIVVIVLATVTWRLSQGPIVLGNVTPYLEAALNSGDSAYRLGIDQAVLTWGDWQHALEVRAFGVRGLESDGGVAFSAEEVVMDLAMPPLLRGEIRPLHITVVSPWLRVVRDTDGSVSLNIGSDEPPPAGGEDTAAGDTEGLEGSDIMAAVLAAGDEVPALSELRSLTVVGADLWIDDRYLDVTWNAPSASLRVTRPADGIRLDADMLVRFEDNDVPVSAYAVYGIGSDTVRAHVRFGELSIARLFDFLPMMPEAHGIKAPVSGVLDLEADGALGLLGATYRLEAGEGEIGIPGFFEAPIPFRLAIAEGKLLPHLAGIELNDLRIETDDTVVTGRAVLAGLAPEDAADLEMTMTALPVDALPLYWPVTSATTARDWVRGHISGGTIDRVTFDISWKLADLDRGDLPVGDMTVDGDIRGTTVTYIPEMPPVENVDGRIVIADDRLVVETTSGQAAGLALGAGVITLAPLSTEPVLSVDVAFNGPLADGLALATHPRLGLAEHLEIDPGTVGGSASGKMAIALATLDDITFDDVSLDITAELSDVAMPSVLRGYAVDRGAGTIMLDSDGFTLNGQIALDDVPFQINADQRFAEGEAPRRVLTLNGQLDQADIARLELPSMVTIEGDVDLTLNLVETWHNVATWQVDVDMTPARLVFPLLQLDKPAGVDATMALKLIDTGADSIELADASFRAADVAVAGYGELAAGTLDLRFLDLSRLVFGRSDIAGGVTVNDDGSYDIRVDGGQIDLVPYMEDLTSATGPELPTFRLDGKLDSVLLTDNDSLTAVNLAALYQGDRWEGLDIGGVLAGGSDITMRIWRHDETERRFMCTAADAGDVMRLFDLFDDARGGTIDMRARIDDSEPERPVQGAIRIDDVTMTNAPILAQLLSLASLTSIANAISGEGLEFKSALVPFTKTGDLVTIEDARAFGPGIGITVEGNIDLAADSLNLEGTLVPAYLVNSILGEIPLLGDILTGGDEGGGVFAVSYTVEGPRQSPAVNVYPLSMLAPGYLRSLFSAASEDEVGNYSFGESSRDR